MQQLDTFLNIALAVAGGSTLIVFAVALQNFFVQPPVLSRPQRFFQDLSVVIGVTHGISLLLLTPAAEIWIWVALVMYGSSLALFLSSIEAARRVPMTRTFVYEPRCAGFINKGPYKVIRHPIYVSYALAWSAAPIAMHSWVLGLTAIGMTTCYVISALEEERRMRAGLGDDYTAYRARTWRFIPFIV
jgi:protein-S-isoprenylcysteine O-methyltransferase Ste14